MKYRFGMLAGLLALGVVGITLLSAIFSNTTVEAARPVDHFSHALAKSDPTGCHLTTDVVWDSKTFAHKAGYFRFILWGQNETGTGLRRAGSAFGTFEKGTTLASIHQEWGHQNPEEVYLARVVFISPEVRMALIGGENSSWMTSIFISAANPYQETAPREFKG